MFSPSFKGSSVCACVHVRARQDSGRVLPTHDGLPGKGLGRDRAWNLHPWRQGDGDWQHLFLPLPNRKFHQSWSTLKHAMRSSV